MKHTLELPDSLCLEASALNIEEGRLLKSAVQRLHLQRLAMKGLTAGKAAELVGCSAQTARMHYADPDFRRAVLGKVESAFGSIDAAYIDKKKSLHEMIDEQAYESFKDLCQMLEDEEIHPSLRVKINQDFLNRCEESQPQSRVNVGHKFSPEELQRAAAVAREIDGKVVTIRERKEKVS